MKHGKITHNIYVDQKEYLNLKRDYPKGVYHTTETHSWFTVMIENRDVIRGTNNFCVEIVFWRTE